jgi:hypothetical protein
MRCELCGGFTAHVITTLDGKRVEECSSHLTAYDRDFVAYAINPCGAIYENGKRIMDEDYAFTADGRTRTISVRGGELQKRQ